MPTHIGGPIDFGVAAIFNGIRWEEPRAPLANSLHVHNTNGSRPATEADLLAAGYVKAGSMAVPQFVHDARAEIEAWRKIDKWLLDKPQERAVTVTPCDNGGRWYALPMRCTEIDTPTRIWTPSWSCHSSKLEALEALASWCEGQA